MRQVISSPTGCYSLDKANTIAEQLREGEEDGWTYRVVDCQNGFGRIDVYDEDDNLVKQGFML